MFAPLASSCGALQQFVGLRRLTTLPFMFHALALALFASLIAPFAGFFASGFKRAFKIKVRASRAPALPHSCSRPRAQSSTLQSTLPTVAHA